MEPAIIVRNEDEVNARLMEVFGITRTDCFPVVHAVVDARNDAIDDDPIGTEGQFAYIYGTRSVRRLFRALGWFTDRTDRIESVVRPDGCVKIIYQSTDTACDPLKEPKAISDKGPASERAIESGMSFLFPEWEMEEQRKREEALRKANAMVWLFCISVDGERVRAEISRPNSVYGKDYSFAERIFIVNSDDWGDNTALDFDDGFVPQEFEPSVTRK